MRRVDRSDFYRKGDLTMIEQPDKGAGSDALLRSAAQDIVDRSPIDTDGETLDEWCHYCDSMDDKHATGCEWAALRAALDATEPEPLDGSTLIATERRRQIDGEGWTQDHDQMHAGTDDLALAAVCYALPPDHLTRYPASGKTPPPLWPWHAEWWKPVYTPNDPNLGRIRELVKAGALIAAQIDLLLVSAPVDREEGGG